MKKVHFNLSPYLCELTNFLLMQEKKSGFLCLFFSHQKLDEHYLKSAKDLFMDPTTAGETFKRETY